VILSPEGNVLTSPIAYDLNIDSFVAFLEKGKAAFKDRFEQE